MGRLEGLDLARFFALVGMVIVNFDVVMVNPLLVNDSGVASILPGRAAALFVVLAGIGFGLAAKNKPWEHTFRLTIKRFIFLLTLGLLNAAIFQADIIHYYAFYFLFGVLLLPLPNRYLAIVIFGLVLDFVLMAVFYNYDQGWDWANLHYQDFWSVSGFFRNLFFNGWHPVIPWLSFLILGIILSRITLKSVRTQSNMLVIGLAVFFCSTWLANRLGTLFSTIDPEAAVLFTTTPIPPMPLYLISAGSLAVAVTGLCLLMEPILKRHKILAIFTPVGRQTLTWYIAHIVLGMGTLENLGQINNQTTTQALFTALLFCVMATLLAFLWNLKFRRGPLETLM